MGEERVVYLVMLAIVLLTAGLLVFYPVHLIRFQGKYYRTLYKRILRLSDAKIDRIPTWPVERTLWGQLSHFVNAAPEHPESFASLIRYYRTGGIVCGVLTLIAVLWVIASPVRHQQSVRNQLGQVIRKTGLDEHGCLPDSFRLNQHC